MTGSPHARGCVGGIGALTAKCMRLGGIVLRKIAFWKTMWNNLGGSKAQRGDSMSKLYDKENPALLRVDSTGDGMTPGKYTLAVHRDGDHMVIEVRGFTSRPDHQLRVGDRVELHLPLAAKEDRGEILPDQVTTLRKDVVAMRQNMRDMEGRLTELVDDRHDSLRQKLHEMGQTLSDLYGLDEGDEGDEGDDGDDPGVVNGTLTIRWPTGQDSGFAWAPSVWTPPRESIDPSSGPYIVEGSFNGDPRWLGRPSTYVDGVPLIVASLEEADVYANLSDADLAIRKNKKYWGSSPADYNWRIALA